MAIPTADEIEASGAESTKYTAFEILNSKYTTANDWARWAATLLEGDVSSMVAAQQGFDIQPIIDAALATIAAIPDYSAGSLPSYTDQSMGTLLNIPAPTAINLPASPTSTIINYTPTAYTETIHEALRTRLIDNLANYHSGLGASVEAALFARETARINEMMLIGYTRITAEASAGGFPLPTGVLLAKQTEMNNETNLKLADSSASIMAESARLAQDYNKHILTVCNTFDALCVEVWNSAENRAFEKAKEDVIQAIAVFLAEVQGELGKAQAQTAYINAVVGYNEGVVREFEANVREQVANIQGHTAIEEVKLRAYAENIKKLLGTNDLYMKLATADIDAAVRNYGVTVTNLQGLAQAASQMVASALNGVNVSSGFSWSGSTGYSLSDSDDLNTKRGDVRKSETSQVITSN